MGRIDDSRGEIQISIIGIGNLLVALVNCETKEQKAAYILIWLKKKEKCHEK